MAPSKYDNRIHPGRETKSARSSGPSSDILSPFHHYQRYVSPVVEADEEEGEGVSRSPDVRSRRELFLADGLRGVDAQKMGTQSTRRRRRSEGLSSKANHIQGEKAADQCLLSLSPNQTCEGKTRRGSRTCVEKRKSKKQKSTHRLYSLSAFPVPFKCLCFRFSVQLFSKQEENGKIHFKNNFDVETGQKEQTDERLVALCHSTWYMDGLLAIRYDYLKSGSSTLTEHLKNKKKKTLEQKCASSMAWWLRAEHCSNTTRFSMFL